MAMVTWSENLSVGVGALDQEHRELCAIINDLEATVTKDEERGKVGLLLFKLADLARSHFADEETAMTASRYPGLVLHALKHQFLIEQIDALIVRLDRDGYTLNEHSLKFLRDWFETHIQKDDLNFGTWFRSHGKR